MPSETISPLSNAMIRSSSRQHAPSATPRSSTDFVKKGNAPLYRVAASSSLCNRKGSSFRAQPPWLEASHVEIRHRFPSSTASSLRKGCAITVEEGVSNISRSGRGAPS